MPLYEQAHQALSKARDNGLSVQAMAEDLGISRKWIYRFLAHDYEDPGARRLEKVIAYLKRKKS